MTDDTQSILERIRKLLALSRDNPNPHEAEAAAAMASRLMLKYSIDESKVSQASGKSAGYTRTLFTTGKFASWEQSLLVWVSEANLCKVIKVGRDDFTILGPKDNVEVCIETHTWLKTEIHRLAMFAHAAKDSRSNYGSMDPHKFHTSFKHGAVAAVAIRLQKVKEEVKAESASNASALMVMSDKLAVFVKEQFPSTRPTKSSAGQNVSSDAYGAGKQAGSKIALKPTRMIS